jgi:2-hydroxychromene-2-carboxylate isomerase
LSATSGATADAIAGDALGERSPGLARDTLCMVDAAFYFDLASPLAYLAAERVLQVIPGPLEWQPVLARELPGADTFESFRCETEVQAFRADVQRRAEELGLQPLRWPEPFPFDSALAMRVATYAKSIGRAVPFAQAAFRQAFAAGRSLADPDTVLIAAAACEMHPQAVLRGAELRSVRAQLASATAEAARIGVDDVPAVLADRRSASSRVLVGERALEDAGKLLAGAAVR